MADSKSRIPLEEDICVHIFTVSAAMVGVCLTVIGLIRIVITLQKTNTLADDLLAGDALLFLTSACFPIGPYARGKSAACTRSSASPTRYLFWPCSS